MIKFTFIFIILYWLLVRTKGTKNVDRYTIICAVLFFIMMGFRNQAIFGDTYRYVTWFSQLGNTSLLNVMQSFEKDQFFWIVAYYVYPLVGGNYTLWLSLISLAIILPITKMIKSYSVEPMYSWILFIFLGFATFFMAGMRQTMAMSLTMLGFLILLDEKRKTKEKLLRFVICIGIASLFHGASLLCLIAILFINRPFSKPFLIIYPILLLVFLVLGRFILFSLTSTLGEYDERYIAYAEDAVGSTFTYFFQQLILIVPSFYILRKRLNEPLIATLYHFSSLGLLLISLSPVIAELFRASYFFSWANILLFPMAIQQVRREKSFMPLVFLLFFVVYLIFINKEAWADYYFWFEDTSKILREYDVREIVM